MLQATPLAVGGAHDPVTFGSRGAPNFTGSCSAREAGQARRGRCDFAIRRQAADRVPGVYDHDPDEVDLLGWDEFVTRQWESIFVGYRSATGLRKICRRWSDLIEVGLGCSQEIADLLVRAEIIDRADRDLEGTTDSAELVSGMAEVLADIRFDLLEMAEIMPEQRAALLAGQLRLHDLIHDIAFGAEAGGYLAAGE
jgi:hypothetical protein